MKWIEQLRGSLVHGNGHFNFVEGGQFLDHFSHRQCDMLDYFVPETIDSCYVLSHMNVVTYYKNVSFKEENVSYYMAQCILLHGSMMLCERKEMFLQRGS